MDPAADDLLRHRRTTTTATTTTSAGVLDTRHAHHHARPSPITPSGPSPPFPPPASTSSSSTPSTSATMIGPSPTFYDPEQAAAPPVGQDYAQWIDSFQQHQQHQHQLHHLQQQQFHPNAYTFAYENPLSDPASLHAQPQQPQQQQQQQQQPLHNQYQFVPQQQQQDAYAVYPPVVPSQHTFSLPPHHPTQHPPQSQQQQQTQEQQQTQFYLDPSTSTSTSTTAAAAYASASVSASVSDPVSWAAPPDPSAPPTMTTFQQRQPQGGGTGTSTGTSRRRGGGGGGGGARRRAATNPSGSHRPNNSNSNANAKNVDGGTTHKRVRVEEEDSESEDDLGGGDEVFRDDGAQFGMGMRPSPPPAGLPQRLPGACTYCKRLKMKCEFPAGATVCKRCRAGNHYCVVEGRKPRSAPNKRELLLAQLRQKDGIIESLLKQLRNPYLATPLSIAAYRIATPDADRHRQNVIAWLDRLQSSVRNPGPRPDLQAFTLDSRVGMPDLDDDESGDEDDGNDADGDDGEYTARGVHFGGGGGNGGGGGDDSPAHPALPDIAVPIGLLAKIAISNDAASDLPGAAGGGRKRKGKERGRGGGGEDGEDEDEAAAPVGVANSKYFVPGPAFDLRERMRMIDKTAPPDILVHKIVTPDDVEKLFQIFYTRVNPFIGVLDPVLHTPSSTFSRCPFLFTVVCAIALRYSDKSEAYPIAMHFAKSAAASSLIDGWKSVELCQAYILMSIYAVPAQRWEEDRSWLYVGLAIRIATDLNLHVTASARPTARPRSDVEEREAINRTRIWMICFNLDKSSATQYGKPSTLREDRIIRDGPAWYNRSALNDPFDIHLVAYSALMRALTRFHAEIFSDPNSPTGLNRAVDFRDIALRFDAELTATKEEWQGRFERDSDANNPAAVFRCKLLPFYVAYSRLVILSFAFQQAFQRGLRPDDDIFFNKSYEAAKGVVTALVDSLAPSGYLRFAPDGHFVFGAFASAFLLKLLRPECKLFISPALEQDIYDTIERLVATFGAPHIAIDERHTPKLYSDFLGRLLAKHRRDVAQAARARPPQASPGARPPQASSSGTRPSQPSSGTRSSQTSSGSSQQQQGRSGGQQQSLSQELLSSSSQSQESGTSTQTTAVDAHLRQQQQRQTSFDSTSHPPLDPARRPPTMAIAVPVAAEVNYPTPASLHSAASPLFPGGTSPVPINGGRGASPGSFAPGTSPGGFASGTSPSGLPPGILNGASPGVLCDASPGAYGENAAALPLDGPIPLGGDADPSFAFTFSSEMVGDVGLVGEDAPATMKALSNPDWWSNMMLPGFYWPQDDPMTGGGGNGSTSHAQTYDAAAPPTQAVNYSHAPGAGVANGYAYQPQPVTTF